MDVKEEMVRLSRELLRHQHLYYVMARPEISDREYDRLFDRLQEMEKQHPDLAMVNSPTRRIGSDLDSTFPEKEHTIPVLSLDKEYSADGVGLWADKIMAWARGCSTGSLAFVVEEKIDGAAIVLYYDRGELRHALTRGNGLVGNDVTENVRTIRSVPLVVPEPGPLAVRGEIFITKADFAVFNAELEGRYQNPRNLAAGSLRNVKSMTVARVPLKVLVYEGHGPVFSGMDHLDVLDGLRRLGFPVNVRPGFFSDDVQKRNDARHRFADIDPRPCAELAGHIRRRVDERERSLYDIDGLVIKVNEMAARRELGTTAHHPRWALAFKFDAPQAQTRLLDVQIQVGRNGRVTPVAVLQPVALAGSVVARATLHNQDYIDMLELGIGDDVSISKRGDIIPAVEEVIEKNPDHPSVFRLPERCPFCQTRLQKEGAHHFCLNEACPERLKRRLTYFCAKDQMDIATLGWKTIELLFDKGFLRHIPDIYTFDFDRLLGEEGFKEKKIANIKAGVEHSRQKPFAKVLAALGLEGLADKVAGDLVKNGFDSIDKIIATAGRGDWEAFAVIAGIGEVTGRLLVEHFRKPANLELIARLRELGLQFSSDGSPASPVVDDRLAGQVWVITGSFENFNPRSKAAEEIEKRGGRVVETVSNKTTHLLAGSNPGSKLAKAQKMDVVIVAEAEFQKLIKEK